MAMTFERLVDDLLAREGGFVDHPDDRGGPTCFGITEAVARAHGYQGPMHDLPRATAIAIYREDYWRRPALDALALVSPALAAALFDAGVNMGTVAAVRLLQRALNALNRQQRDYPDVLLDGVIGRRTLEAVGTFLRRRGAAGEAVLLKALTCLRGARYIELAEARAANESFLYGWLDARVASAGVSA